jgi:hypothetical protein
MKIIIAVITLTALLSSCAALSTQYQNPVTKEMKKCEAFGIGWIGAPAAFIMQEQCKGEMKKAGFAKIQ